MLLAHKRLDEITEADLQALVGASAAESETVEFTESMWGNGDEDKRDMLREIVALANHRGGELFIGISEVDGAAFKVVGVEGTGIAERIQSSCNSNVERPLIGFAAQPVPLSNGRSVVVIRIPASLSSPHMITFKGLDQFWIRRGRQKGAMTVDEIESAYARRFDAESGAERFVRERVLLTASEDMKLYWSVTPFFLRNEVLNPLDEAIQSIVYLPPRHPAVNAGGFLERSTIYPTIHGIEAVEHLAPENLDVWRMEVHRSGYAELVVRNANYQAEDHAERVIYPSNVVLESWRFFQMVKMIYERVGFSGPVLVTAALNSCTNAYLDMDARGRVLSHKAIFRLRDSQLLLPSIGAQNFPAEVLSVTKIINDRLWNAFREPACPYISEEGDLKFPRR